MSESDIKYGGYSFCHGCKTPIHKDDTYCEKCANDIEDRFKNVLENQQDSPQQNNQEPESCLCGEINARHCPKHQEG